MINPFEELLRELSVEYGLTLHPDHKGACKLKVHEGLFLQIEFNPEQNTVNVITFICEIPPGKFRENTLKVALQNNHLAPHQSRLAYFDKKNQLVLFQIIPLKNLTGKLLSATLSELTKKADEWRQAIETGTLSSVTPTVRPEGKGMFGLTR